MKKLQFIALLMVLFGMSRLNAQITSTPYQIINLQNCNVTVAYRVTDCMGSVLCSGSGVVIGPGVAISVPCGNIGDDIQVVLTHMDGIPVGVSCTVSTPGGSLGVGPAVTNTLPASVQAALAASGCATPTGDCSLTSTGASTDVGY
jgi:hypothetical protein